MLASAKGALGVRSWPRRVVVTLLLAAASAAPGTGQDDPAFFREPPEKIVTAEACGECHVSAYATWQKSEHATGFRSLHRKERAEMIARKMGFRLIKRASLCLECHYTPVVRSGELRAASGVSCESCHGAARDWINLHNNYGKGFDRTSEPAAHRTQRIEASVAAGMRRPDDLYAVAANCFGCHTVPKEELVNAGGHSTGTPGFELAARIDGEIRHNFLDSFLSGDGTVNRALSAAEKRVVYLLGRALDLEYSLRGAAEATRQGVYAQAMGRRVQIALLELRRIAQRVPFDELARYEAVVRQVQVVPGNRAALEKAADEVGAITRRMVAAADPARLAALDPMVEGRVAAPAGGVSVAGSAGVDDGAGSGAATGGSPPAGGAAAVPGAGGASPAGGAIAGSRTATASGRPAVGTIRRRIRPPSQHATLGPGACAGCHEAANNWLLGDPHARAARPFLDRAADNLKIARLYGLATDGLSKGDRLCMDCHGTVITGYEAFDVFDGVSCESCHGAAADWLEPHKDETDKALGKNRPGYRRALELGKRPLDDPAARALVCTGCHYVTDPRLLSAGHPSGKGFEYLEAMRKIQHWPGAAIADAGALRAAFDARLRARGAVPEVELAVLGSEEEKALAVAVERAPRLAVATGAAWNRPRPAGLAGLAGSGPGAPNPGRPVGPIDLPPLPAIDLETPVEEVLLILKERLDRLHRAVRSAEGDG